MCFHYFNMTLCYSWYTVGLTHIPIHGESRQLPKENGIQRTHLCRQGTTCPSAWQCFVGRTFPEGWICAPAWWPHPLGSYYNHYLKGGSQEIPGVTGKLGLGVRNEAEQRLTEFCQENTLVIANTLFQQHKRKLYTWTSPNVQYQNQIDYILCTQRWRSTIQSVKTRPGATLAQIMNSLLPNSGWNWRK